MTEKSVFQSQMEDRAVFDSLRSSRRLEAAIEAVRTEAPSHIAESIDVGTGQLEAAMESLQSGATDPLNPSAAEAIIMLTGYPSLLIRNGDYENPDEEVWRRRLDPKRNLIKSVFRSVGRVEFKNHPQRIPWVGTCWMVDENVLITNRHVAQFFAEVKNGSGRLTQKFQVYADFNEEIDAREQAEFLIGSLLYIEPVDGPAGLALMRLANGTSRQLGAEPLPLNSRLTDVEYLGVVGYPADDLRNNPRDAFNQYFKGKFGVKRFAPGRVMDPRNSNDVFTHNCTTLGGNSGSVVFDIATGAAIGLHFGGNAQVQNYAVKASTIADRMRKTRLVVRELDARSDRDRDADGSGEAPRTSERFDDRDGYRADFIGPGPLSVPLPILSPQMATRAARTEKGEMVLNYRHYSAVLSKTRRLAYFSASNIDGNDMRNPRRPQRFQLDPRLSADVQTGEVMYRHNDFDKGHLVRRLDPCWGKDDEVAQANRDTMFFPNIAPQHKNLNQKLWAKLEDHILSMASDEHARICVFVGCVFSEQDPVHKPSGIKVPLAFWKVIASATATKRRGRRADVALQAQALVMSQESLVKPSDLEIVFGEGFETFQVTVEQLERMTGLDFHKLKDADTFGLGGNERESHITESPESAGDPMRSPHFRRLSSLDDIVAQ